METLGPGEILLLLVFVAVSIAALVFAAVYLLRQRRGPRDMD